MPSSEARILANRRNAQHSTGPKSPEGKDQSRRNSLKHGLTGAGVVMPEADAAEVDRRAAAFAQELNATGDVGLALARHAALSSVRMERAADQQTAALTEHVRRVDADFVGPEGVSTEEATRLRSEAARRAMFDPSKEASLARRYAATAERGFFRAIKELRQMEKAVRAGSRVDVRLEAQAMLGSILQAQEAGRKIDRRLDTLEAELDLPPLQRPTRTSHIPQFAAGVDLPFTIGKRP